MQFLYALLFAQNFILVKSGYYNLYGLAILIHLENIGRQGYGQAKWRCRYPKTELPYFDHGDYSSGQLNDVLLVV
jgi:hypothetical protein